MRQIRLLLLAIAVIQPALAVAQTAPPPPPTYEETLQASYVGVGGNASSNTFGLGADVIARPGTWIVHHTLSFVRNDVDGVLTANTFDYRGRVQKTLSTRASAFGEYEYFRDRFAGIRSRNTVTGGLSLKAITESRQTLAFDIGVGAIDERRLAGVDVSSGSYLLGSAYLLKMSETTTLRDNVQVSGVFSDAGDWRVAHSISIATRLVAGFSLEFSNTVRYAHFPPPGFKTTDAVTSLALVAKFAHP